ncbi:phospholipase/carboxylesterase family protein-like protein [Viridothelium virens]|uniref:Phospholipase/carboxylesterase family protein-like protein n=1 Tax=Viridothelium virens TaxID=1048519 RepID=A0A6A6HFZ3_VIRVR|nr:phospholipase/carboxylesterase family protein-like protein [Viridothelium virens]
MDSFSCSCHTISPSDSHTHTVIFLHGRDSTAEQFEQELFESQASDGRYLRQIFPQFRWIFPKSQVRPSMRFGEEISQWFDMWSTEDPHAERQIQLDGLRSSIALIRRVIDVESKLVAPSRIILCGISQGCATAISTLLCGSRMLGGFVGMCGWMPYVNEFSEAPNKLTELHKLRSCLDEAAADAALEALATPIFVARSQDDDVVPIQHSTVMRKCLQDLGMQVTWQEYHTGGHWVHEPQGIDDLVDFMSRTLAAQ